MDALNIVINWAVCIFFVCGLYLWLRRHEGDRSRRYLCLTWIFASVMFVLRLINDEFFLSSSDYHILPIGNLIGGIMYVIVLYLYPVRVINDEWFGRKFRNFVILPGTLLILVLVIINPYSCELKSFEDILQNIGEYDVVIRLIVLFLGILPYTVLLFYIPYNYTRSGAYYGWILSYSVKILLIGLLYIIFMLTGSYWVSVMHVLVNVYLCVTVTYYELFVRFSVPDDKKEQIIPDMVELSVGIPENNDDTVNPMIKRIFQLMDEQQIWKSPDLNLIELASMLNTNRSYLSKAIKDAGYKNYSDMINRRRISEFVDMAKSGKIENVQDAFFSVGFRSRETALRCFKKYIGVLPTDYLRNNVSATEI